MISDEAFLRNVRDARENGFRTVCSECGMPLDEEIVADAAAEGWEPHATGCPGPERWATDEAAFAARLRTILEGRS